MEVTAAADHAGEEDRSGGVKDANAKVVVPVVGDAAGVEPCVIAVDDSSVDRALVTALLRRSKYRGEDADALHVYVFWSFIYTDESWFTFNLFKHSSFLILLILPGMKKRIDYNIQ